MEIFFLICVLVTITGLATFGIYAIIKYSFTASGILFIGLAIILLAAIIYTCPSSKLISKKQDLLQYANETYIVQENTKDGLEYTFLYCKEGEITVLKAKYRDIQFIFTEAATTPFVEINYHPCAFRDAPAEDPQYTIYLQDSYQISELAY